MKIGKRDDRGFTVIELLVVIIIVCLLGLFVGIAYSGVQAKNRNKTRQDAIDLLKSQLESYYAENNTYPTLANLNDTPWRAKNLKKIAQTDLQDPRWSSKVQACTHSGQAVAAAQPTADCYSYQVTSSDGSACDNVGTPCAHYTLTATLEGGEKYVKSSLN